MEPADSPAPLTSRRFVNVVAAVAAIGGLLFGYDTGVISDGLLFIRTEFDLSPLMEGVVVSSLLVGATIGALVAGRLADRFGRRTVLLATSVVFAAGALLAGLAPGAAALVLGRFVLGLAIGPASAVVPLYIAEMVPADRRGALVNANPADDHDRDRPVVPGRLPVRGGRGVALDARAGGDPGRVARRRGAVPAGDAPQPWSAAAARTRPVACCAGSTAVPTWTRSSPRSPRRTSATGTRCRPVACCGTARCARCSWWASGWPCSPRSPA